MLASKSLKQYGLVTMFICKHEIKIIFHNQSEMHI